MMWKDNYFTRIRIYYGIYVITKFLFMFNCYCNMFCAWCSSRGVWMMIEMLCIRLWGVGWPVNDGIGKCFLHFCYKGLIGLHL